MRIVSSLVCLVTISSVAGSCSDRHYEPGLGSRLSFEAGLDGCPGGSPIPLPADCPATDFYPRICAVDCDGNTYGGGEVVPAGRRFAFSVRLDPNTGGVNGDALTDPEALALRVLYDPCQPDRSQPLGFVAEKLDQYQLAVHVTEPLASTRAAIYIDVREPIVLPPPPVGPSGVSSRFDFGAAFVGYCADGGT